MKRPVGDLADLLLIDRRLRGEVEALEVAHEREASQADAHFDAALVLARNLTFAEQGQCLSDTQLAPRRLVDQAVDLVTDRGQLQPVEHLEQMVVLHHQRPPTNCSYSMSGRSSSWSHGVLTAPLAVVLADRKPMTPSKCSGSTRRSKRPAQRGWIAT